MGSLIGGLIQQAGQPYKPYTIQGYRVPAYQTVSRSWTPKNRQPAYAVLTRPSRECTGNTFLCEDVLLESGVTDLEPYSYVPGADLQVDLFVDHV